MSDHIISEFSSAKQVGNHVDIDIVDESWALKLLNECEAEDSIITIDSDVYEEATRFRQSYTVANLADDSDMSSQRLLTAIECQKLAFEEKQRALQQAELDGKNKQTFSLSRLKAFFAA